MADCRGGQACECHKSHTLADALGFAFCDVVVVDTQYTLDGRPEFDHLPPPGGTGIVSENSAEPKILVEWDECVGCLGTHQLLVDVSCLRHLSTPPSPDAAISEIVDWLSAA